MKLVLASEPDHVGEWVYPGMWEDLLTPPENALETELIDRTAFSVLWEVLDPNADLETTLIGDHLPHAGYPHYGPSAYDSLNPILLDLLLAIPVHERWKTARDWSTALKRGQAPNKERLGEFKRLLNRLCELVARRGGQMLVVLPLR